MELKEKIIEFAREIEIDLIGFTTAEPFEDLREILMERKNNDRLSGFEENDIEARIDPRKTLPEAKSIVVIGLSYYIDEEGMKAYPYPEPEFSGELARTAWGRDYHLVLTEKLEQIAQFIKGQLVEIQPQVEEFQYKAFVDTGPLVDRKVAQRAGLGWYGLNSNLINEKFGSWFFIGYMITNIPFVPDPIIEDTQCHLCEKCIAACPAGAIEKDYGFDATKCLSCRLQKKEVIPVEERTVFGKRLYGCDICQQVCPHNQNIKGASSREFIPSEIPHKVDLLELLTISNQDFKKKFGRNASGWRGKRVLQRNAIMALVNHQDPRAVAYLLPLLKDPRPEIRHYVIWAISELSPELAAEHLTEMKKREQDEETLRIIDYYLNKLAKDNS